jgi:signal peptidase I
MYPTLKKGDIVLLEKTNIYDIIHELNPKDVKVGDIILYKYENPQTTETKESGGNSESNILVIHRIIGVGDNGGKKYFILKGDNNPAPDAGKVYLDQIVGRALKNGKNPMIIPGAGNIILWIQGSK